MLRCGTDKSLGRVENPCTILGVLAVFCFIVSLSTAAARSRYAVAAAVDLASEQVMTNSRSNSVIINSLHITFTV